MLRINRVIRERSLINERDKMIERLKSQSIRDPLTELYNSRHFYAQLEDEIQRSERYVHLLLIARKMKTSLRSQDTAYRFAGDEFTIILPETTADNAKFVADRIKAEMEKESLVIRDKEIAKITLSIGIAEYQRNEKKEQFVHRADVTMYEAKKRGGNDIAVSPRLSVVSNKSIVESSTLSSYSSKSIVESATGNS